MSSKISRGDFAFGVAVTFLVGIFFASLGWNVPSALIMVAVAVLVFLFLLLPAASFCAGIFFVIILFGSFYFHLVVALRAAAVNLPVGKEAFFRAVITGNPESSQKFLVLTAYAESPFSGELTIFADPGSIFHYGDVVAMQGVVHPAEQAGDDPVLFPQKISLIATNQGFFLRAWMIEFKEAILQKFNDVLPADEAALLGAMTLGGTQGMSDGLKNQMSLSGTSYLATMYGYKMNILIFESVGLLAGFIARRKRFFLIVVLMLLFVAMTGGEPSAIRAAIMGCMALSARELGRMPNVRNALTFTALVMVLADPTIMVQAAFLLSFLSLLGIVYLGPALRRWLGWDTDDHGFLGWKDAVIMSGAALLPIIPVIVVFFGQFSLTAFVSNALVFPAMFPLILFGCTVAFSGFASHYISFILVKFAEIFIWYELGVIRLFSLIVLPLTQIFTSTWSFVLYYAAVALFLYHYREKYPSLSYQRVTVMKSYFSSSREFVVMKSSSFLSSSIPSSRRRPGPTLPVIKEKSMGPHLREDDKTMEDLLENVDF